MTVAATVAKATEMNPHSALSQLRSLRNVWRTPHFWQSTAFFIARVVIFSPHSHPTVYGNWRSKSRTELTANFGRQTSPGSIGFAPL